MRVQALPSTLNRLLGGAAVTLFGVHLADGADPDLVVLMGSGAAHGERGDILRQAFQSQVPVCEMLGSSAASSRPYRVAAVPIAAPLPSQRAGAPGGVSKRRSVIALLWLEETIPRPGPRSPPPPPPPSLPPALLLSGAAAAAKPTISHASGPAPPPLANSRNNSPDYPCWSNPALRSLGTVLSAWLLGSGAASVDVPWLAGVLSRLQRAEGLEALLRELCAAVSDHTRRRYSLEVAARPALVPRAARGERALLLTLQPLQLPSQRPPPPPLCPAPLPRASSSRRPPLLRSLLPVPSDRPPRIARTGGTGAQPDAELSGAAFMASAGDACIAAAALRAAFASGTTTSGYSVVVPLSPPADEAAVVLQQQIAAGHGAQSPLPGLAAKAFPLHHTLLRAVLDEAGQECSPGPPAAAAVALRVVEDTHTHVQDVHKPSGDIWMLMGLGRQVVAGDSGCALAPSAGAGGAVSGGKADADDAPQSLVLLTLPLGDEAVLALYLCFPRRLPGGLLEAVRASGQELLEQALRAPLLEALHGRLAAEYETLRSAVPGSYAVVRPASVTSFSHISTPQLELAGAAAAGRDGGGDVADVGGGECDFMGVGSAHGSPLSTMDIEAYWAPPPPSGLESLRSSRHQASSRTGQRATHGRIVLGGAKATSRLILTGSRTSSRSGMGLEESRLEVGRPAAVSRMCSTFRSGSCGVSAGGRSSGGGGRRNTYVGMCSAAAAAPAVAAPPGIRDFNHIDEGAPELSCGCVQDSEVTVAAAAIGVTTTDESLLQMTLEPCIGGCGGGGCGGGGEHHPRVLSLGSCAGMGSGACASSFITVSAPDEESASLRRQMELLTSSIQSRMPEVASPAFPDDLDALALTKVLGKGGGGTVFQGSWNSLQVAVKVMEMPAAPSTVPALSVTALKAAITASPPPATPTTAAAGGASAISGCAAAATAGGAAAAVHAAAAAVAAAAADDSRQLAVRRELLRMGMERAVMPALSHPNILQVYFTFPDVYLCTTSEGRYRLAQGGAAMRRAALESCPAGKKLVQPMTALVCEWADCGSLAHALAAGTFRRRPTSPASTAGPAAVLPPVAALPPAQAAAVSAEALGFGFSGGLMMAPEHLEIDMQSVYLTLLDVALALRHLHASGLVHRDVKPANLLLRSAPRDPRGFTAKLADFGFVLRLAEAEPDGTRVATADQACGTVTHMPPESFLPKARVGASMDIYAFGILMWEMVSGATRPFPHLAPDRIPRAVARGARPSFTSYVPLAYRSLAQACWSHEPRNRPSAADLVAALSSQLRRQ